MYTALQLHYVLLFLFTFSISWGVIASVSFPEEQQQRDPGKKYGDVCEGKEYCQGELVSCQHGICSCFTPENMIYDEFSHGCVVLAGKKCELNTDIWKVSVNCIEGAFCDTSGLCMCSEGYYTANNGSCISKKLYKESCTTDQECDNTSTKSLVCIDGVCACDKRGQIYDEEREACVALVDSECVMEDEDFECTSNAVCRQGRCVCKSGFAKSVNQECKLGFGADCNPTLGKNCADIYFNCINGQCQCKHPMHQIFDERTQECLSLVSGPCTFPKKDTLKMNATGIYDIQKCVKNAYCGDKGFYSECGCRPGFVQTLQGGCAPGFGEPCEADECDPITPLSCRNGVCACNDLLQHYDPTIKKCVGLVGSRCTKEKPNCIEFGSCVIPATAIAGQCICDKYSVETANRTCVYRI